MLLSSNSPSCVRLPCPFHGGLRSAPCRGLIDVIGWRRVSSRGTARGKGITRRDLLRAGAAAGALASVETLAAPAKVLEKVLAAPAACGALSNIEHVVIFI